MEEEDVKEKQQQKQQFINQEPEITSEENSIDEDELELCLGLRPINSRRLPSSSSSSSLSQNAAFRFEFVSKRDEQAFRRLQAKRKRDMKRKSNQRWMHETEIDGERVCKAVRLHAPSWTVVGGGGGGEFCMENEYNNRQSVSSGSSSGISDNHQSSSGHGGNTSSADAMSTHSSQSCPQLPASNAPTTSSLPVQPPCSSQSDLQPSNSTPNNHISFPPQVFNSSSNLLDQHCSNPTKSPSKSPDKGSTLTSQSSLAKPPRPTNGKVNKQQSKLSMPQMPCVSATGNGPNAKTITGFLYKYTKTEVSIVCVCHGASFTPAGFVEHAGGVDVEHPLRHIRVVPFTLA